MEGGRDGWGLEEEESEGWWIGEGLIEGDKAEDLPRTFLNRSKKSLLPFA